MKLYAFAAATVIGLTLSAGAQAATLFDQSLASPGWFDGSGNPIRASGQIRSQCEWRAGRFWGAFQPRFLRTAKNAFTALVTIVPMVRPLLLLRNVGSRASPA